MNNDRIVVTGDVLFGTPRIKGTRVSVEQVLQCLAQGWTYDDIMQEFDITSDDIRATITFAYESLSTSKETTTSQQPCTARREGVV